MHRGQEKRACLQALACQAVGSGNEVERRLASTVEGRKAWGKRAVHIHSTNESVRMESGTGREQRWQRPARPAEILDTTAGG